MISTRRALLAPLLTLPLAWGCGAPLERDEEVRVHVEEAKLTETAILPPSLCGVVDPGTSFVGYLVRHVGVGRCKTAPAEHGSWRVTDSACATSSPKDANYHAHIVSESHAEMPLCLYQWLPRYKLTAPVPGMPRASAPRSGAALESLLEAEGGTVAGIVCANGGVESTAGGLQPISSGGKPPDANGMSCGKCLDYSVIDPLVLGSPLP